MNLLGLIISTDFVYMWIRVATPIIFASLGAVICTKAGVVNLGLEGIMLISALAGVLGSAFGGNLVWGVLAGLLAAVAVSAVFAYFHLVLKANNVLCGTAVNTMATGLTVFVLQLATGEKGNSSSLKSFAFPNMDIPVIRDIPVIGTILSGHNALTYFALFMVAAIWFFLSRSFFADSSYMLSFSVLCSCVCSRLISPSVSSWHKQDNTLMHQSPGHIQRRTPYNF